MEQYFYTYFNWFGASTILDDGYGLDYTTADVVSMEYIAQPEEAATVTFDSYPPKGWLGYCSVANCAGQTPSGVVTGYEYNAQYYYFVYYATSDAYEADAEGSMVLSAEMTAWLESFFVWLVPAEPEAPSSDGVAGILEGIGAASAPLTVTLLWNAPVDLDLYFYCDDGSGIGYDYGSSTPGTITENCGGSLDKDMTAGSFGAVRGDGSLGQVENISVQSPTDGHTYNGRVEYYGGEGNAPFQVVFSGTDNNGVLHVFGQEHVAEFLEGPDHNFSVVYPDPNP